MVLPDERMGRSVGRRRQSAQSLERETGCVQDAESNLDAAAKRGPGVPLRQECKTVQSRVRDR